MKNIQQKTGPKSATTEKMPQSTTTPVLSADGKPSARAFGSPPAAMWSKYIDSRMKQFGTR